MSQSVQSITIIQPDDWHLHLRDGAAMKSILPYSARSFARAIIMPNLPTPVTSLEQAQAYKNRIMEALPADMDFEPLMTLYLTDNTTLEELHKAKSCGFISAIKLYPAGATTNSNAGVTNLKGRYALLEEMQKIGLPLLVHGEVTDPDVDMFERENVFMDKILIPLSEDLPELKIVFEHITTKEAAQYVAETSKPVAATITPHHLIFNRNALFQGGIRPHYYCLPVLKEEEDRQALIKAATSGNKRFFCGTDSAPHPKEAKERMVGAAGCFSAMHAVEMYAQIFDQAGKLDQLESFMSLNGPDFYQLPVNKNKIHLSKEKKEIPESVSFGESIVVPLHAGETVSWKLLF